MRILALIFLLLCSCAAALPYVAAAASIADRALDWIAQVDRHVSPNLHVLDDAAAQRVRDSIATSRAAAMTVKACGQAGKTGADWPECEQALVDLERHLATLFAAARPLGVQEVGQPGLLGAPPGGVGVLGVPSACSIVKGAEKCPAPAVAPAPAPTVAAPRAIDWDALADGMQPRHDPARDFQCGVVYTSIPPIYGPPCERGEASTVLGEGWGSAGQ
jgi:hypothetical protein